VIKLKIDILKKKEVNKLKGLLSIYQFHDYRSYRMLKRSELDKYLLNQILDLAKNKNNSIILALEKNEIIGLASLVFLPWDTGHFNIKMGKVGHIISVGSYEKAIKIKNKLLVSILDICKREHFAHLSCRIDIEDLSSIHVLGDIGFKIMETIVTFVFNCKKHKIPRIRTIYEVRKYEQRDLPYLIEMARSSFSEDRFHLDPFISQEKADSLYSEWIKNSSCKDSTFVAISLNQPVGFFTHQLYKDLAHITHYKIMGKNGLMAVLSSAKGAIIGLMKTVLEDAILNYDYVEFYTQLSNREVIRLFQKFNLDSIRAKYTFHKWM